MFKRVFSIVLCLCMFLFVPITYAKNAEIQEDTKFEELVEMGKNQEVSIFMWGGNNSINMYYDDFIAKNLKELYNITLKRVPMNAPDFVAKLLNEKKNRLKNGSIDIIWVNAENFRALKKAKALYGPFTQHLQNQKKYYDTQLADLHYDNGIAIEGYEAILGSAQLVHSYDSARMSMPPTSYKEFLEYAKKHPNRLTYANPVNDFVGSAFVRNAYFELTDFNANNKYTYDEFLTLSKPVIAYFKELHPYLWNKGNVFPANVSQQYNMFKNNEIDFISGFEVFRTQGLVEKGEYPKSARSLVFENGTIGNSHYLAIPYNARHKAAALLVIDFLQSPLAQIEKMKAKVWGDLTAIDTKKLSDTDKEKIAQIEEGEAIISSQKLFESRIPDMNAQYIDWIEKIWEEEII